MEAVDFATLRLTLHLAVFVQPARLVDLRVLLSLFCQVPCTFLPPAHKMQPNTISNLHEARSFLALTVPGRNQMPQCHQLSNHLGSCLYSCGEYVFNSRHAIGTLSGGKRGYQCRLNRRGITRSFDHIETEPSASITGSAFFDVDSRATFGRLDSFHSACCD
jgi:hypothetical protein